MSWRVVVAPSARRTLAKLDPPSRRRVHAAIDLLSVDPRPPSAIKRVGSGTEWRVRTGDFRVIYELHDAKILVLVLAVGHRRGIYRQSRERMNIATDVT